MRARRRPGALPLRGDAARASARGSRSSTAATASGRRGRRGRPARRRGWSPAQPGQPQRRPPDLWLLFAPIKKARTDFIVEKATELGAARIQPVFTRLHQRRAAAARPAARARDRGGRAVRRDLRARGRRAGAARGAARRLGPGAAADVLRRGARAAPPAAAALAAAPPGPWAVLIGPEGGFAPEEAPRLRGAAVRRCR